MTKKVVISLIILFLLLTSFAFAYENEEDVNIWDISTGKEAGGGYKNTSILYELIDKGILYKTQWDRDYTWTIKKGEVAEVACSPLLKNLDDRLVFVHCKSLDEEGILND